MELCSGVSNVKNFWVNIADTDASACYKPDGLQEDDVAEAFFRQQEEASHSQAPVLIHPSVGWRDNTARHKQPRRFLGYIDYNFLTQVTEEQPLRHSVGPDIKNTEGLFGHVKVTGSMPWLQ